jgi:EmrB/QacA subfamily drug resistance transporter
MSLASRRSPSTFADPRWISLIILCTGMLMIVLDATIVNVALPSIQHDLGFSQSGLAWVVNGYLIAFGGLLLLAGRLGDLIGRKRIFLAGMVLFTAASVACGLAVSQEMLIAARFIQGVGGAMTSAVVLGMIVTMFTEPGERARALGAYSFVASAGASIGLLLSGVLTEAISWHWIFFVNLPIGIATAVIAYRVLPWDRGIGLNQGTDALGAGLVTGALMLGVAAIVRTNDVGWGSIETAGLGTAAIVLLGAFVVREAATANPLLPLRIFRSRTTVGANVAQALMVAAMFGTFFLGSLYLQRVLGMDPIAIGLAFLPVSLGIGVLSLGASARLITRYGARLVLVPSLSLMAAALAWFSRAPVNANYAIDVFPSMLLIGVGAGLAFPALVSLAMAEATPSDAGFASGLVNTTRQVGGALGLAILATISSAQTGVRLEVGDAQAVALTSGFHSAFAIGAVLAVAAVAVVITVVRPAESLVQERRRATSARISDAGPAS